jgi:hypothetical protein
MAFIIDVTAGITPRPLLKRIEDAFTAYGTLDTPLDAVEMFLKDGDPTEVAQIRVANGQGPEIKLLSAYYIRQRYGHTPRDLP